MPDRASRIPTYPIFGFQQQISLAIPTATRVFMVDAGNRLSAGREQASLAKYRIN